MNTTSRRKMRNTVVIALGLTIALSGCSAKQSVAAKPSLRTEKATCHIGTIQIADPTATGTTYTLNLSKDCLLPGKWLAYYSMYGGRGNGFSGHHEGSLVGNTITLPEMQFGYGQTQVEFLFFPHSFQAESAGYIYYDAGARYPVSTSANRSLPATCKIGDVAISDATSKGTDFTVNVNDACRASGKWIIQYDLGFTTKYAHLIGQREVSLVGNTIHVKEFKYPGNAYAYVELLFFPNTNQAQSAKFIRYNS